MLRRLLNFWYDGLPRLSSSLPQTEFEKLIRGRPI